MVSRQDVKWFHIVKEQQDTAPGEDFASSCFEIIDCGDMERRALWLAVCIFQADEEPLRCITALPVFVETKAPGVNSFPASGGESGQLEDVQR